MTCAPPLWYCRREKLLRGTSRKMSNAFFLSIHYIYRPDFPMHGFFTKKGYRCLQERHRGPTGNYTRHSQIMHLGPTIIANRSGFVPILTTDDGALWRTSSRLNDDRLRNVRTSGEASQMAIGTRQSAMAAIVSLNLNAQNRRVLSTDRG